MIKNAIEWLLSGEFAANMVFAFIAIWYFIFMLGSVVFAIHFINSGSVFGFFISLLVFTLLLTPFVAANMEK